MINSGPDTQTITLTSDLLRQAERRATQINVSRDRIIEMALTNFFATASPTAEADAEDARYLRAVRAKQARAEGRW